MPEWIGVAESIVGALIGLGAWFNNRLRKLEALTRSIEPRADGTTPLLDRLHGKVRLVEQKVDSKDD